MDVLALGSFIIDKTMFPDAAEAVFSEKDISAEFGLD